MSTFTFWNEVGLRPELQLGLWKAQDHKPRFCLWQKHKKHKVNESFSPSFSLQNTACLLQSSFYLMYWSCWGIQSLGHCVLTARVGFSTRSACQGRSGVAIHVLVPEFRCSESLKWIHRYLVDSGTQCMRQPASSPGLCRDDPAPESTSVSGCTLAVLSHADMLFSFSSVVLFTDLSIN